jgi:outer membrane protein assembly factor BamB
MKKIISRNIALVSAVFIVAFSIMLIANYFQVSGSDIIQSEMIEKLKTANEEFGSNPQLQEQIRELDLLVRKAYFISLNRFKTGIAILLVMLVTFVISLRLYFAKTKDIPGKEIDPIDDWILKSKTRKYITGITSALVIAGILFAVLTSPYLRTDRANTLADTETKTSEYFAEDFEPETQPAERLETPAANPEAPGSTDGATTAAAVEAAEVLRVTHNAFRGNNALGTSSAKKLPTSWDLSSGKNILWRVKVPRKGYNSPVINGNKVFFTGGDEEARELFCYELSTGKQLWKLAAKNIPGSPNQMPETTEDTGLAAPTAVTNGKQVCAIFATGDIICADMDGNLLWAKNIGVPDIGYGYSSSLLIYGNSLIIQYDTRNSPRVMALDLVTGNQRWSTSRPERNPSWSSPILAVVNNHPQLILVGNPGVASYNPNTGEQNWRVAAMGGEPAPGAAYANGIVFAGTEYATMVAINAADGSELWRNNEFLPEIASPVATRDFLFVATTYGIVASFEPKTGKVMKSMETGADFNSSPIIAEGKIYLICTKGKVFIFSAKVDFSLMNSFETGESTFATSAFTDGKIIIKTEDSIYCVSSEL